MTGFSFIVFQQLFILILFTDSSTLCPEMNSQSQLLRTIQIPSELKEIKSNSVPKRTLESNVPDKTKGKFYLLSLKSVYLF